MVQQEISVNELRNNLSILRVFSGLIAVFLFPFYHYVRRVSFEGDWGNFIEKYSISPDHYLDQLTNDGRQRAYLYSVALG